MLRAVTVDLEYQFQECAIERGSIVFEERVEARFDDEPAKFDEAMRAFTPVHDPLLCVLPGQFRFKAMVLRFASMISFPRRQKFALQLWDRSEKASLPVRAM